MKGMASRHVFCRLENCLSKWARSQVQLSRAKRIALFCVLCQVLCPIFYQNLGARLSETNSAEERFPRPHKHCASFGGSRSISGGYRKSRPPAQTNSLLVIERCARRPGWYLDGQAIDQFAPQRTRDRDLDRRRGKPPTALAR